MKDDIIEKEMGSSENAELLEDALLYRSIVEDSVTGVVVAERESHRGSTAMTV